MTKRQGGMRINGRRFIMRKMSEIKMRPIQWIWEGFLPRGQVIMWYGKGGAGKSTGLADIAARVTTGGSFPGGDPNRLGRAGRVVIINQEDSPEENIKPKMLVAGADEERVSFVDNVYNDGIGDDGRPDQDRAGNEGITDLYKQVGVFRNLMVQHPDSVMVIVDPITAFMGDRSQNSNSEVKQLITELQKIAEETRLCIVIATHMNKSLEAAVEDKIVGSVAWWHGPRLIFSVEADEKPGEDPTAVVRCRKANICRKPLPRRFTIQAVELESEEEEDGSKKVIPACGVVWDPEPYIPEEQEDGRKADNHHRRGERLEVKDWVWAQTYIPVTKETLMDAAQKKGYNWKRIQRALKELRDESKILMEHKGRNEYVYSRLKEEGVS